MRFMMLMIPKGYESAAPGTLPDAKMVAAMMQYNEALAQAGVFGFRRYAETGRRGAPLSDSELTGAAPRGTLPNS